MTNTRLTRRTVLGAAVATGATVAAPFLRSASNAANVVADGQMVLAWHTNIATRWLDPAAA